MTQGLCQDVNANHIEKGERANLNGESRPCIHNQKREKYIKLGLLILATITSKYTYMLVIHPCTHCTTNNT